MLRTAAESNSTIDPEPSTRSAATLMQDTLTNLQKELSQQGLVVNVTLMMQEKLGLYCFVFRKVQLLLLAECGSSWVPGSARRRGAAARQAPRQKAAARNRFYRTPALPWTQSECTQPPFGIGHIFPPRESIFWHALFSAYPFPLSHCPTCRVELCFLRLIVERTLAQLVTAGRLNKRQPGLRRNLALLNFTFPVSF